MMKTTARMLLWMVVVALVMGNAIPVPAFSPDTCDKACCINAASKAQPICCAEGPATRDSKSECHCRPVNRKPTNTRVPAVTVEPQDHVRKRVPIQSAFANELLTDDDQWAWPSRAAHEWETRRQTSGGSPPAHILQNSLLE